MTPDEAMLKTYREALVWIAEHYEGCDISDDDSAQRVVKRACRALGWTTSTDEYGQLEINGSR